jgi:hypothetical protein
LFCLALSCLALSYDFLIFLTKTEGRHGEIDRQKLKKLQKKETKRVGLYVEKGEDKACMRKEEKTRQNKTKQRKTKEKQTKANKTEQDQKKKSLD